MTGFEQRVTGSNLLGMYSHVAVVLRSITY